MLNTSYKGRDNNILYHNHYYAAVHSDLCAGQNGTGSVGDTVVECLLLSTR